MGETKMYIVLVRKPEGKRPLGRPRRRWDNGIRMYLSEISWVIDWIQLAQDRGRWRSFVNMVMKLLVLAPTYLVNIMLFFIFKHIK
jgi:hypothetical protein